MLSEFVRCQARTWVGAQRGDSGPEKGPCLSFPACHFFHSQSELGLLLFRNPDRPPSCQIFANLAKVSVGRGVTTPELVIY